MRLQNEEQGSARFRFPVLVLVSNGPGLMVTFFFFYSANDLITPSMSVSRTPRTWRSTSSRFKIATAVRSQGSEGRAQILRLGARPRECFGCYGAISDLKAYRHNRIRRSRQADGLGRRRAFNRRSCRARICRRGCSAFKSLGGGRFKCGHPGRSRGAAGRPRFSGVSAVAPKDGRHSLLVRSLIEPFGPLVGEMAPDHGLSLDRLSWCSVAVAAIAKETIKTADGLQLRSVSSAMALMGSARRTAVGRDPGVASFLYGGLTVHDCRHLGVTFVHRAEGRRMGFEGISISRVVGTRPGPRSRPGRFFCSR